MAAPTFINKSIDDYNYTEWLGSSLKFQRPLPKRAAGSANGTIKIIDCTGPINKARFQLGAAIRLILIMEKPLFPHCSPFALSCPNASHMPSVGFHGGWWLRRFIGHHRSNNRFTTAASTWGRQWGEVRRRCRAVSIIGMCRLYGDGFKQTGATKRFVNVHEIHV